MPTEVEKHIEELEQDATKPSVRRDPKKVAEEKKASEATPTEEVKTHYTVREACTVLRLLSDEVRNLCNAGILRAEKYGRGWRIPLDAIEEYLEYVERGERPEAELPVQLEASPYWIGIVDDAPRQYITLAGVCFPRETFKVTDTDGGLKTQRERHKGAIAYLVPEQIEKITEASNNVVVRMRGKATPVVVNKRNKRYRAYNGDHPIAKYVYMISLDDAVSKLGANWREFDPPTME